MAISISQWWLGVKDSFAIHLMVSPYDAYEISMWNNRDLEPRKQLGIGPTGNAGVAAISVMVETSEGAVGCLAMVEVKAALAARGSPTELPAPN